MNVREEINRFASEENKPILNWLFNKYHWASQWSFVAKCTFLAKPYPNNYRIWEPTFEGKVLYERGENES